MEIDSPTPRFRSPGLDGGRAGRLKTPMSTLALRRDDSRLAVAALVFGALVIATSPILVRLAACGPAAAGFWRLGFAMPLLALMAVGAPRIRAGGEGAGGIGTPSRAMLLAGLWFALDLGCWHYGIRYTSVANATVLPNLTPVIVTLVSWFAFRERPRAVFLVGMATAIAGAVLMAETGRAGPPGPAPHIGDILSASTAHLVRALLHRGAQRPAHPLDAQRDAVVVPGRRAAAADHGAGAARADPARDRARLGGGGGPGPRPRVRPGLDRLGARPAAGLDRVGDRAGAAGRRRDPGLLRVR